MRVEWTTADWLLAGFRRMARAAGSNEHVVTCFARFDCLGKDSVPKKAEGTGQMKIGTIRLQRRTMKGLYYAAGSFTILMVGAALLFLMGVMLMPAAREVPWR
jgi:hypothetical protein